MLDDRHYMRSEFRGFRGGAGMPLWQILIIINIAAFFLQLVFTGRDEGRTLWFYSTFALSLQGLLKGYIWQLVTYQFMHAGLFHLVMNCIGLYFIGRIVGAMLGRQAFLVLFFAGGIVGGLLQAVAGFIPAVGATPTVGASAAVMSLLGAFCIQFYHQRFQLIFPPVTITGKHLLIFVAIFDGLGILSGARGGVAHFAHLGGLATGVLFMKNGWQYRIPEFKIGGRSGRPRSARRPSGGNKIVNANFAMARDDKPKDLYSDPNFIAKEVDPILEKISAHGIQSLTNREREILEKAQKHMSKR